MESIASYAFSYCTNLTSITFSEGLKSLSGTGIFEGCGKLGSLSIPASVTSISSDAFYLMKGLTSIVVNSNNTKYDSRNNCNAIIIKSNNTLLKGCKNTTIPSSVTSIGSYAFYGASNLASITIPSSVTTIGSYAFAECNGLTSVTIPSSVTSIGSNAFKYVKQIYYSGTASGSPWGAKAIN